MCSSWKPSLVPAVIALEIGRRNRNPIGQSTCRISSTQQVSRIDNRYRSAVRIKRDDSLAGAINCKCRSEAGADEIELLRQRTLSSVERQEFKEATEVVIQLDVAVAGRIDGNAESRRVLTGEAICVTISRNGVRTSDQSFLFSSQTEKRGDETDSCARCPARNPRCSLLSCRSPVDQTHHGIPATKQARGCRARCTTDTTCTSPLARASEIAR